MKFHGDIPFFHQIGQDSSFRGATDRVSNYSWSGVSNPSAVIDISRGEEKFRSLISAILCLMKSFLLVPSLVIYDYTIESEDCKMCVSKKFISSEDRKFVEVKKIIRETSRNYFVEIFREFEICNFPSHSCCAINKFYSFLPPLPPLENFLSVRFFFTPELIFRRIYSTAMVDFYMYNSTSTKILGTDLFPTVREHSL